MIVGERIRALREAKGFSQGDMEKCSGLLRCYISRVENGHATPSLPSLEKMARALDVSLYLFFYDCDVLLASDSKPGWQTDLGEQPGLFELRQLLGKMSNKNRRLLLFIARYMALRNYREKT